MIGQTIILATKNPGKVREFRALMRDLPYKIESLIDRDDVPIIIEDGASFRENAMIKARIIADTYHHIAVADDSGLEVDALGGRPGIYSARFAGEGAGDQANNAKLLALMECIPWDQRTGRFRCSLAIVVPGGPVFIDDGVCEGIIGYSAKGVNGFGYDPLFYVPEYDMTFAELNLQIKNQISHRAIAFSKAKHFLERLKMTGPFCCRRAVDEDRSDE